MRTIATIEGFEAQAGFVSYEVRVHERTPTTPPMISLHRAGREPTYFTPRAARAFSEALFRAVQALDGVA